MSLLYSQKQNLGLLEDWKECHMDGLDPFDKALSIIWEKSSSFPHLVH